MAEADVIRQFAELLERHGIRYCLIGGQAVNAYVEPLAQPELRRLVPGDILERLL